MLARGIKKPILHPTLEETKQCKAKGHTPSIVVLP